MWNKYIDEVGKFDWVVIYGAGQIGRKVLGLLEKADMRDKVICFAVSDMEKHCFCFLLVAGLCMNWSRW